MSWGPNSSIHRDEEAGGRACLGLVLSAAAASKEIRGEMPWSRPAPGPALALPPVFATGQATLLHLKSENN